MQKIIFPDRFDKQETIDFNQILNTPRIPIIGVMDSNNYRGFLQPEEFRSARIGVNEHSEIKYRANCADGISIYNNFTSLSGKTLPFIFDYVSNREKNHYRYTLYFFKTEKELFEWLAGSKFEE